MAAAQPAAPAQAAAPVPPAGPRRMEGILDSKIVGKVKQFDGQRSSWKTFEFHWKAYLVANDFRFRRMFQAIEDEPDVAMLVNDVGSVNNPDFEPLSSQ
eukprot:8157656-Pyramimonas_sp.AAC.1